VFAISFAAALTEPNTPARRRQERGEIADRIHGPTAFRHADWAMCEKQRSAQLWRDFFTPTVIQ